MISQPKRSAKLLNIGQSFKRLFRFLNRHVNVDSKDTLAIFTKLRDSLLNFYFHISFNSVVDRLNVT